MEPVEFPPPAYCGKRGMWGCSPLFFGSLAVIGAWVDIMMTLVAEGENWLMRGLACEFGDGDDGNDDDGGDDDDAWRRDDVLLLRATEQLREGLAI
ncbi:hypothetical protein I7I53_10435 [Histoplasma capsulatum var. duboisii H88]|uniref:Uncharacterized protein n=1 Tax=Ajellomyces capsulatus (strain H88) TaxID=544711 RepID=A0A8A1L726_AJEC8|nr:hypothetical protein I7I53_10435 [Histoplasma capsulatum var. duboisii H88]